MDPEIVFTLASRIAMAAWLLLILLPRHAMVVNLVAGAVVPGLLATTYVAIVLLFWSEGTGGFSSLAAVGELFEHPWILLAGWIHYLAFDLLVGRWELLDAQARGIRHVLVVPCLVATFLFGPAGWLAYLGLRSVAGTGRLDR